MLNAKTARALAVTALGLGAAIGLAGCGTVFRGKLGPTQFEVHLGQCRLPTALDRYKGSEPFRGRDIDVYTDPNGGEWVRLPGDEVMYELTRQGPLPPLPLYPRHFDEFLVYDARPWEYEDGSVEPAEAEAPEITGDMTVEIDEANDFASVSFVLPAPHVADFVDPDTTPFDVDWSTKNVADGLLVSYAGAMHHVAGAAMYQGIEEINGTAPGVGVVTIEIDSTRSLAIVSVNGELLPDEERPFRAIWSADAP